MLEITVGTESYDEETEEFVVLDGVDLQMEHSLVSLSKWESRFEKSFIDTQEKTGEEILEYIKMMTLTPNVAPEVWERLTERNFTAIHEYLGAKMSATWFSDIDGPPKVKEVITAEVIYYWFTVFNIPMECQYWHLNRLFTFVRVCSLKQAPPKKPSRAELAQRNTELNRRRREELGTTG